MFTNEQIEEFKENARKYPWMGDCVITPGLISFKDLMYHENWRLLPPPAERSYFAIHHEYDPTSGEFRQCNAGSSIESALKRVNDRLWDTERRCGGADLSRFNLAEVNAERTSSRERKWDPFGDWYL